MGDVHRVAVSRFVLLFGAMTLLLFLPACTLRYWQAWLFLVVFASSWALMIAYLWTHDPALLARRVNAGSKGETRKAQRCILLFARLAFIGALVVAALDHRFAWSGVPLSIVILGNLLVAIGALIVIAVFRENTFTSATIELVPDQRVISTGPYAVVRHPMYSGALVMMLGTPLALGSYWGLLMVIPMMIVIVWRLLDEESFLSEHLAGYDAYRGKVRHRLIPLLW